MAVVNVLAQQFYGWLCSVYLPCWHVHVVDEDDRLLVRRRPEITLLSTIHLRHYHKLHARNIAQLHSEKETTLKPKVKKMYVTTTQNSLNNRLKKDQSTSLQLSIVEKYTVRIFL